MRYSHDWVVALILSFSGTAVFGLLCLTAVELQDGIFILDFELLGGIRVGAVVKKIDLSEEDEELLLLNDCPEQSTPASTETETS